MVSYFFDPCIPEIGQRDGICTWRETLGVGDPGSEPAAEERATIDLVTKSIELCSRAPSLPT